MNFEEAKTLLNSCERSELRDHAFGDTEICWVLDGAEVADGYFGNKIASVSVGGRSFFRDEARELRKCGKLVTIERNDTTGPEEYQEGVTMHLLTPEGVLEELTAPREEG